MSIGYIFLDLKKVVSHVQRAITLPKRPPKFIYNQKIIS